jgi:acyl carrier protein
LDRSDVFATLRGKMALALEVEPEAVTQESRLIEDLDADSLDLLELVLGLKDEFGITINDGEVKTLLIELAQFLPDAVDVGQDISDAELAEVTRRLRVENIVDFIIDRMDVSTA